MTSKINTTPKDNKDVFEDDRRHDAHQMMLDRYDLNGDGKLDSFEQQNIGHDMLRMEDIAKMLKKGLIFVSVLAVGFMISNIGTVYFVVWLTKDVKVSSDGVMQNMNGGTVKTESIAPMITLYDVSDEGGTRRGLRNKRAIHRKLQDGSNVVIQGYIDKQKAFNLLKSGTIQFQFQNGMKSCEVTAYEKESDTDYTVYTLDTSCGTGRLEFQEGNAPYLSITKGLNNDNQEGLQFSIKSSHACALFSKEVHCVGYNYYGQLGTGYYQEIIYSPIIMSGLENKTPLQVVTGDYHTCVLVNENDGSVYCVGRNNNGQLGDTISSTNLVQVKKEGSPLTNVKQIAAGGDHNCAILEDDSMYCWGASRWNQLGFNNEAVTEVKFMALSIDRTCIVTAPNTNVVQCTNLDSATIDTINFGNVITKLTAGDKHFCALLKGGTAKCFGNNYHGQLGNGSTTGTGNLDWNPVPQSVLDVNGSVLSGITDIDAGPYSNCLVANGEPMCFGMNGFNQLGIEDTSDVLYPTRVPVKFPNREPKNELVSVHSGFYTNHAVFSDNTVFSWGSNIHGTLGDGSAPRQIFGIFDEDAIKRIFGDVQATEIWWLGVF